MLLAILIPGLSMMLNGHFLKGIVCFILQFTILGWIPAAIWGVASRSQDLARKRHDEMLATMQAGRRTA
ncbi:YqaE/Pmp3 family membrane protein [Hymenobacter elongatus]|uniref:YqaE/Pmp3 family membrane protein n=1 Tax=Hymenobacter elongatus TaxID=877208 RepID=A0A4Z0PMU8_9BACT|nr:YqaE/Pmp3 family membrane protein [Hymenobacter elongatus]